MAETTPNLAQAQKPQPPQPPNEAKAPAAFVSKQFKYLPSGEIFTTVPATGTKPVALRAVATPPKKRGKYWEGTVAQFRQLFEPAY